MKDQGKIKEKDGKGELKIIFLIGIAFLLSFGLIIYGIVKLTNQYFSMKEQLNSKQVIEKNISNEIDNAGPITLKSDSVKVDDIKQEVEQSMGNNKVVSEKESPKQEEKKETSVKELPLEKKIEDVQQKKTETQQTKKEDSANRKPKDIDKKGVEKKAIETKKESVVDNKKKDEIKKDTIEAKKVEESKKAVATEKVKDITTKKQPAETNEIKSKGKFALQLFALKDKEAAEKEVNRLKSIVKDIYIEKVDLGEKGIWYRVRCCNSDSKDDLMAKKEKIKKETGLNPIPVSR